MRYKYYRYGAGYDQFLKSGWNQKTDGEKMNSKMKDSRKYERPSNEELRKKMMVPLRQGFVTA